MHSLNTYPAKTALSKKALTLKLGMSKDDARALLGNPTWAETISGVQKESEKPMLIDRSIVFSHQITDNAPS